MSLIFHLKFLGWFKIHICELKMWGLFGLSKSCLDHVTNTERTKDFTFLLPGQDNKYFTSVI
jgi:hypothetical protein